MELNLDEYLRKQKEKLESDRIRLDTIENQNSKQQSENHSDKNEIQLENVAIAAKESTTESIAHQLTSEEYKAVEYAAGRMDFSCPAADLLKLRRPEVISSSNSRPSSSDIDAKRFELPRCNRTKPKSSIGKSAAAYFSDSSNLPSDSNLSKVEKECANARRSGGSTRPEKNAMEEWVSDTFYSYFPSFNVLDKKRENLAKDRQQDYQNYLKKISANESKPKRNPLKKEEIELPEKITKNNKSETEIIVNNPSPDNTTNKDIDDDATRPGSTKHKLLQDLKHTALSNIVNGDGVLDRNRIIVENETKKKLEYQKQLMIQIEEKRNEAKALKEREKIEEELLAKKLEEQLKTMQLEDALEKERIKVEKARIANEQNQIMRIKLLAKLDNDKKLLQKRDVQSESGKENITNKDNNVYKYFSNSARHNEYNKYAPQNFFDTYESDTIEPTTLHHNRTAATSLASENICSFCNTKLKTSKCLNCETKLPENDSQQHTMLCEICQGQFSICPSCDLKNTPCLFCHRRRNVCTDCIRNFCSYCGNVTRNPTPIVTSRSLPTESGRRSKTSSIRSFKVLDISYEESDDDSYQDGNYNISSKSKKPYSINIEKKSIFHPDNKIIEPKYEINIRNGELSDRGAVDRRTDIFIVGQNTNERLSRYLKNYGDLSGRNCKSQSTQTGKDVERIETSPSIPLLRPAPKVKVTKISEEVGSAKPESDKIKNLSQKWEIPVVQKNIISSSSPRVLTQLGAIRKQLQIEQLELEPADKNL